MPDLEKIVKALECCTQHGSMCGLDCNGHYEYSEPDHKHIVLVGNYRESCPYGKCETGCVKTLACDALALLKKQECATVEPKRPELPNETKEWLDKMDAVEMLGNIADICIDWDGYRTANGLGGLINEIWAYARYGADKLMKEQSQQDYKVAQPTIQRTEHVR